jgi:hypothetical protein
LASKLKNWKTKEGRVVGKRVSSNFSFSARKTPHRSLVYHLITIYTINVYSRRPVGKVFFPTRLDGESSHWALYKRHRFAAGHVKLKIRWLYAGRSETEW